MTVVDSSAWLQVLGRDVRPADPQAGKLIGLLHERDHIAMLGVVMQEVLQGIRDERLFARITRDLESLPFITLDRDDYVAAARLRTRCLARGVQAGTVDIQIAAACLQHDCALLTCDADFTRIADCCELQLL